MKRLSLLSFIVFGLLMTALSYSQKVTPQLSGSKCYFQVANVYFEVYPAYGGRISSLKLDNKEIMYIDSVGGNYLWGSTFWQSPQSDWNWPPSTSLDQLAYSGGIYGDSVNILSKVDDTWSTNLRFRKTFYADLSDTSVTIKYFMINTGSSACVNAPWEITRVPVGGMEFFPDTGSTTGPLAAQTSKIGQLRWLNYTGSSSGLKCFGNSLENWTAWINSDSAVFIKKFSNVPSGTEAPGESEIEYYYSGPGSYYELENQGEYSSIIAKDSLKWVMKWYVRKLPKSVDATKGSVDLANFVRTVVGIPKHIDAIKDSYVKNNINISPNPARELIKISGLNEPANIILTDISGRIVLTATIRNSQNTILVNSLAEGFYLYNIYSSNARYSGKLIIKR